jgi:hypothetical protein
MGLLAATGKGATSLVDLILKKFGNDVDGATQELVRMGGFPEPVARRIATGELPMDAESVAKRVQDQGHGNVVYRGINGEYDPDKAGYYQMFTTSKQDAAEYGDNLLEVRLNLGDNAVVDGRGRNFNSIPTEDGRLVRTDDLAHEAREAGRDSLTIRNIHDKADNEIPRRPASSNSGPSDEEIMRELGLDYSPSTSASPAPDARNYDPVDVDVVYDPSRIRSVNAAYDPQYTGPNIMGSAALPVAAGLLTAGQSEDADASIAALAARGLKVIRNGDDYDLIDDATSDYAGKMTTEELLNGNLWSLDTQLGPNYRGQGIGNEYYDAVEEVSGKALEPSPWLSADGAKFWAKRNPEALARMVDEDKFYDGQNYEQAKSVLEDFGYYAERGNADPRLLAGIAGTTAAGLAAPGILNAPPVVAVGTPQTDSGILSAQLNNHDQGVDQHMLNLGIDPRENPMYDYGAFLPVRQNIVTGKSEMAMPSFLRDTIRGLLDVAESRNSGVFRPDGLFEML